MNDTDIAGAYKALILSCAQVLRSDGYAKRGASFRKMELGNAAILELQKSRRTDGDSIVFTMNLGVVYGRLLNDYQLALASAGTPEAHVRQRIGMLLPGRPDKWWTIDSHTDVTSLIDEITALLNGCVIPFLDRFLHIEEAIDLWQSGQSPGLTETQRVRYLAQLEQGRGVAA